MLRGESVQSNPYLREFAAAPWLPPLLAAPECASLLAVRGRSLRKELSEALGAVAACRRALRKLPRRPLPPGAGGLGAAAADLLPRKIAVVDLCCGKGFGSLMLALSMPDAHVVAVDSNRNMELAHFRLLPNLVFQELDITSSGALVVLSELLALAGPLEAVVFVGVHLCGDLSRHAARLFRHAPAGPAALVLAPCCLDGRTADVKRRARRLKVDPHLYWCLSLLFAELPCRPGWRRELLVDDDVLSAKNTFLIASRDG